MAFALFFSLFGIALGRLADGWYRVRLLAFGLALWSGMTVLSGFANSLGQLAIARVGVGIGEATASPTAYSLLADYFAVRRRALVLSIYSAGLFVGAGLSLQIGGWAAHAWTRTYPLGSAPLGLAGWQAAFLAVGLPGLLLALWVLTLREPARGLAEGHPAPVVRPGVWREFARELAAVVPPFTLWSVSRFPGALRLNVLLLAAIAGAAAVLARATGDTAQWIGYAVGVYAVSSWAQMLHGADRPGFTLLLATRATLFALLGFGGLTFVSYSVAFWMPPYAIRTFGITSEVAGLMMGVPIGLGSAVGVIAGGRLSDAWKRRDPRGRIFVCVLAAILPAPLLIAALTTTNVAVFYLLNPVLAALLNMWLGSGAAVIQDCVLPRMRGTAAATFLLPMTLIGLALGPYSTGKVAAITGSLRIGILSLLVIGPLALLALWIASRRIAAAEETRFARARSVGENA
jgi:MFS family permease